MHTPHPGEFVNYVNGDTSEKIISQPGYNINTADGKLAPAGQELDLSTLLAFDTRENFFPSLPIALLPPLNEKDIEIYGGEGKIYEIFYAKGAQQFTDEDLNMWLSTIPGTNMQVIYLCVRVCARAVSMSMSFFFLFPLLFKDILLF